MENTMNNQQLITTIIISIITSFVIFTTLNPSKNNSTVTTTLQPQITAVQSDISSLQTKTGDLETKLNNLTNHMAIFTPSSQGYTPISTAAGNLAVSLKNIEKYANGYKLHFNLGNPTLATFADVQLKVSYNKPFDVKENTYYDWLKGFKTVENSQITLLPGRWNNSTIIISPASEQETGTIILEVITDKIILSK